MRICTKCNKSKPLTEYHKDPKGKNGQSARCKECKNSRYKPRKNPRKGIPPERVEKRNVGQLQAIESILRSRGARLEYHEHLKTFYFYAAGKKTKEIKSLQELLV